MSRTATTRTRWALLAAVIVFGTATLGVSLDGGGGLDRAQGAAQARIGGEADWVNPDAALPRAERSGAEQRGSGEQHRLTIGVLVGSAAVALAIANRRRIARWSTSLDVASSRQFRERAPPFAA